MLNLTSSAPTPLRTRNYRLYFSGQLISVPGTWLQTVAQAWLVLELSSSGSALGVTVALQTVPVLVLGAWTGSVADRIDKRKLLLGTQATQGLLAAILGTLALTGVVQLWMVWILALGLGITRSFDTPTRQAFVSELVEGPSLARAIGINSTVVSAARMIGPAAGGVIIAAVGVGWCFLLNAASFAGPLIGLLAMDASKLIRPEMPATRKPHAVRAGLRYVRNRRDLLIPLLMMALVGTLAFEFQVTIPLMAHSAFHLGATGFGLLYAAMGAGAVVSGITLAGKVPGRVRTLAISAAAFGIALAAAALVPTPAGAAICLGSRARRVSCTRRAPTERSRSAPTRRCAAGWSRSTSWPSWAQPPSAARLWASSDRCSDPVRRCGSARSAVPLRCCWRSPTSCGGAVAVSRRGRGVTLSPRAD